MGRVPKRVAQLRRNANSRRGEDGRLVFNDELQMLRKSLDDRDVPLNEFYQNDDV
jgi:hypothetical protein